LRYYQHKSQKAGWSARIALLFLVLFTLTLVFHRFGIPNLTLDFPYYAIPKTGLKVPLPALGLDPVTPTRLLSTPTAMKLFGVAVAGAVLAVTLAAGAFVSIWRDGHTGVGNAVLGLFVGALMLAMPLWSLPSLLTLPRIHEVSTDTERPPAFDRLAVARHTATANPAAYQREDAAAQLAAYPDIKPLTVERPLEDAFGAVRDAVRTLKWKVVSEEAPTPTKAGMIEAVDRTMIFGFTDDVVIRVTGGTREAQVDVRSSSRHGDHDLGRNAARVRTLFSEVRLRLDELDKAERLEKAVALREKRVKKALKEKRAKEAAENERQRKERLAAQQARERLQGGSGMSGTGGPDTSPSHSQSASQDEPGRNRKRHGSGMPQALRKFWELLGQ
jgi:uncharacterized protein (DUF1499 family)